MTVATAAPAASSRGTPNNPKMNTGSSTMLVTAPMSWVVMAKVLRPVDTRIFSIIHCTQQPRLKTVQMVRYSVP